MDSTREPAVDAIAALLHVADAAVRGQPVAPSVAAWLARGVKAHLDTGEALNRALGLRRPGWSAPAAHRRQQRDRHLRQAIVLTGGSPDALAVELDRFIRRQWPAWRALPEPPERASELQRALFATLKTGAPVPSSSRHLRRIVAGVE